MNLRQLVRKLVNKRGYQIIPMEDWDVGRRIKLMRHLGINAVLDVGANIGQYATTLRKNGFTGHIYSFEPQAHEFSVLSKNMNPDHKWRGFNFALGSENCNGFINESFNSWSSSILDILPASTQAEPTSAFKGQKAIEIKTLDSIYPGLEVEKSRVMLKLDTQGYEKEIFSGAPQSLEKIPLIQLEMCLVPLYKGELQFFEMNAFLNEKGFSLVSLENGFNNTQTGQLLSVDGVYVRREYLKDEYLLK